MITDTLETLGNHQQMDVYCHVSQSMARESAARAQAFYEIVKPV